MNTCVTESHVVTVCLLAPKLYAKTKQCHTFSILPTRPRTRADTTIILEKANN